MCGIFGWMVEPRRAPGEAMLRSLTDILVHRGPDGAGIWRTQTTDGRTEIAFGHRRLSIIDLGGGRQPMTSADGRITLTFNGEIYNYVELREDLRARGHVFQTDSDTEVLVEAYRAWGTECLSRFRGMFAFALFDSERQRVFMARDPFGKKPLFLAQSPGAIAFASEVNALLAFPGTDRDLDWASLDAFLIDRYVPGPATFFRGIRKLPPGCYALHENGTFTEHRYYTPPFATIAPDIQDFREATRLFTETFDEAVRLRMRSDAPFGAFLSGGIDSSAVVAAMSRHSRGPVRTFAVGFAEGAYSELAYARTIAEHFRTEHAEKVVTPDDFFATWPEALQHLGAPLANTSDVPILLLSRLARQSVKMVLTGEGADELLAGYPKHRAERWIELYGNLVPGGVHDRLVRPAIDALPYNLRRLKVLAAALGERDPKARFRRWFGGLNERERAALTGRSSLETAADYPFSMQGGSSVRRALFFDQTSWLPDNLLERGDRMMMGASIEGRMPFMDSELARLAARFPDRFMTGHRKGKAVLRAAMAQVLPPEILHRKKAGFRVPVDAWLRGPYRGHLHDLLGAGGSETRRILDTTVLDRLIEEHVAGRQNHEKVLWSLLNLELFLRTFKPGLGAQPAAAVA